jgi:polar amino acid transport system substrate-binding protein
MHQLTQQLKSGKMEILEVPFPSIGSGQVMVRNHYSVISSGTEGRTVSDARKGYIAKAKSRQKELKQVFEMIKLNGLKSTYQFVMNKLDAPSSLGYSCAGEIIAIGEGVTKFKVGDKVACGGNSASHADVVSVPENLCVKIPDNVDLKQAAFTTIGAISIQGIRQAELKLGENCLIIGMGLIGQMTAKILQASGIKVIGVDVSDQQVKQAIENGLSNIYNRSTPGIEEIITKFSYGNGVDAIIITAGTSSLDPIEFAGKTARKKGKVVIVGAVPTGFERANYYKKELELKMSMSYGPGRGDINYEEKGIDYPIGYVRWTENRNMQSFVELLSSGNLDISKLISHKYSLENSPSAYDMILSKNEPYNGIVIEYEHEKKITKRVTLSDFRYKEKHVNVGIIGAGNFAQGILLPKMKEHCNFIGISTNRGNIAKYVGVKYNFNYCAETADDLFIDNNINTIFITTRHDTHAKYIIKAIENSKNVFVEKPMAMNELELVSIKNAYVKAIELGYSKKVMVGFNRRFSPAVIKIKKMFNDFVAKSINIRINSGSMPPDHWVNDPLIGGGRIIGECCHFIDLAMYLAGSPITAVYATSMNDSQHLNNTATITLDFENGSIASVNYFSNGSKSLSKEMIEVFCGGTVAVIDDFKILTIYGSSSKSLKFKGQDKGHQNEIVSFISSILNGTEQPISFDDCYMSSLATIKAIQSSIEKRKIEI